MKEYGTEFIRNVALVGHGGWGKTSLAEAFLFNTGVINRLGKVEDGTTVSDFDDEERRRKISISTSVIPVEYQNHKINFLDTPGFTDFVGEVKSALHVADAAIVVVDSVAGVEVGAELVWQYCDERKLPRFVVINKMDRENANFQRTLESVQGAFKANLIPVQLPWGEQQNFKGVGAAAEGEDELLEKYLGGEELTADEVIRGFHKAVLAGSFVPVFIASAATDTGINPILDGIVRYFPAPTEEPPIHAHGKTGDEDLNASDANPLCVHVWKTTADPFVGKL